MAVTGRSEEFAIELSDSQREMMRRLTGHHPTSVNLVARNGTIDPQGYGPVRGPVNGPYRMALTEDQSRIVHDMCGLDIQALYFDVVGTEAVFAAVPSEGFPICYPQPQITTCDNKPPHGDCSASEVLRDAEQPLVNRFVPVHLRHFRDGVMRRTEFGSELIEQYYKHSPELSRILRSQPEWLAEAREQLLRNSAQLRAVTLTATLPDWAPLNLNIYTSQRDVDEALDLLERIIERAGPELGDALRPVLDMLGRLGNKTTSEILAIFEAEQALA